MRFISTACGSQRTTTASMSTAATEPGLLDRNHECTFVDAGWISWWAGKALQEAADFVRNAPKPPKALNKVLFVVLDKEQHDAHKWLTVCKVVEGEVQSLPCVAPNVADFLIGHDRDTWLQSLYSWQERGIPRMDG